MDDTGRTVPQRVTATLGVASVILAVVTLVVVTLNLSHLSERQAQEARARARQSIAMQREIRREMNVVLRAVRNIAKQAGLDVSRIPRNVGGGDRPPPERGQ